jgi:hypothetical protein
MSAAHTDIIFSGFDPRPSAKISGDIQIYFAWFPKSFQGKS